MGWMLNLQMLQAKHDQLYCSDVARMSPAYRAHHLVTLMAKYVFNIQRDAYTRNAGNTVGKRVTDMIITAMSLLTSLNVDMGEMIKRINPAATCEGDLLEWFKENYKYHLSDEVMLDARHLYEKRLEYTVALPRYMHEMVEAVTSMVMMDREMKPISVLANAAMHVWIQCVISHAMHGHSSFTEDVRMRLNEIETKNIHWKVYGLYPNYQYPKTS